ncbi:MAG: hypothetical protein P8N02_05945, partial [Actinomycetota bacterium]|nr:hypothetical protein [Actinomycetota bacterium]
MEHTDALEQAMRHLGTLADLIEGWRSEGRLRRMRSSGSVSAAGAAELAAAIELVRGEVERQRLRADLQDAAIQRIE